MGAQVTRMALETCFDILCKVVVPHSPVLLDARLGVTCKSMCSALRYELEARMHKLSKLAEDLDGIDWIWNLVELAAVDRRLQNLGGTTGAVPPGVVKRAIAFMKSLEPAVTAKVLSNMYDNLEGRINDDTDLM